MFRRSPEGLRLKPTERPPQTRPLDQVLKLVRAVHRMTQRAVGLREAVEDLVVIDPEHFLGHVLQENLVVGGAQRVERELVRRVLREGLMQLLLKVLKVRAGLHHPLRHAFAFLRLLHLALARD